MLGKGLESLIPPNQGKGGGEGQSVPSQNDKVKASSNFGLNDQHNKGQELLDLNTEGVGEMVPEEKASRRGMEAVFQIEVDKIKPNPHQPRRDFDESALKDLAASIREVGILQPLVVTKVEREVSGGTEVDYVLIAGERRLMAAKLLGLERVPAIVKRVDFERERLTMAIIENLQREGLNPIETARAFARLQDEFALTQREIATRLGKSREAIANSVRLLDLPVYIQDALISGGISETHGRLLLAVQDQAAQRKLFDDILTNHLTTREVKERVSLPKNSKEALERLRVSALPPELVEFQEKLAAQLGTPVKIDRKGLGGKITISFYSDEELKGLLDRLEKF